jgi:hypothetical protein
MSDTDHFFAREIARQIALAGLDSNEIARRKTLGYIRSLADDVRLEATARLRFLARAAGGDRDLTEVLPEKDAESVALLGRDVAEAALALAKDDKEKAAGFIEWWFASEPGLDSE